MRIATRIALTSFAPDRELAEMADSLDGEGALVSFVGIARSSTKRGERLTGLFLDHHPRLTERSIADIAAAAAARFDVTAIRVVHRCGMIEAKEPIVFAAAAAGHRRAAFEAADYLMDRLKTDALLWKREDGEADSRWIEPTDRDHDDRARWSDRCPE